uniref:Nodule-specific cysteine-rich peptide G13 n=1 Tax=Pisum sativum TaxID=3888 RepID=A0A7T8DV73_PEA|nr:nodule-specific cysteine-rich peptide G13 [Pisum sativum]
MAKISMFVYGVMIFLSIFISITNCSDILCETKEECPTFMCIPPRVPKCDVFCYCAILIKD